MYACIFISRQRLALDAGVITLNLKPLLTVVGGGVGSLHFPLGCDGLDDDVAFGYK